MHLVDKALPVKSLQQSAHRDLLSRILVNGLIDVTVYNKRLAHFVEELQGRNFHEEQFLVLQITVDGLVYDARVTLKELIGKHLCKQVPSEYTNTSISRFSKTQEPAV